jgi:CheY-like chemotaxis protein
MVVDHTNPKCILVVDDEKPVREAVRLCLEMMGNYQVLTADSGEEGLQIAETKQPDAILLDLSMPDMDGLMVFQRLLKNAATRTIPVILLTAQTEPQAIAPLTEEFAGVITKPFAPTQLAAQVAAILTW